MSIILIKDNALPKIESRSINTFSLSETTDIIHELYVHEIGLETKDKADGLPARLDKYYSDTFDITPMGIFISAQNGCILDVNILGAEILHADKKFIRQKPFISFLTSNSASRFMDHVDDALRTQEKQNCKLEFKPLSGPDLALECQIVPLFDTSEDLAIFVLRNQELVL